MSGACAAKNSIGSQVACKLSLEHFTEGVLEFFDRRDSQAGENGDRPLSGEVSQDVLEAAFKRANASVYDFGHKLAAGGRMAASLIGIVIEDSVIAAGRVGPWSAYLHRSGTLYPFFDEGKKEPETLDGFVGAQSLVTVETASVPIEESDMIIVFSSMLDHEKEVELSKIVEGINFSDLKPCQSLSAQLFPDAEKVAFAMLARIGPDAIYLSNAV